MSGQLIDNKRITLKNILIDEIKSGNYNELSIATGYWDLKGMLDLIDYLDVFKHIRLLIGKEPIPDRLQKNFHFDANSPEELFPDEDFAFDLENISNNEEKVEKLKELRNVSIKIANLIKDGILEVKVFRKRRLHAKAYILGTMDAEQAIGIVGSSNFTNAGLETNLELNYLENDSRTVLYQPQNDTQPHGHLSWFNEIWSDPEAISWTGDFSRILENSPIGNMTYGRYDVYIKTLMKVFPDEMNFEDDLKINSNSNILLSFQNRNASSLIKKLKNSGIAMLSDSVGLGKTVTAGAVIKHFLDTGSKRVVVIAPAGLRNQWKDDLGKHLHIAENDFEILSMQNIQQMQSKIDDINNKSWIRNIDLFVIDEAHNLRSQNSKRYKKVRELLETSPEAPVLMLTATPINNSLMDFANQIQLADRGRLNSIPVQYKDNKGNLTTIDFYDALQRIQAELRQAENKNEEFDWTKYEGTLKAGLRHYLVRSTRQGVEKEGTIYSTGEKLKFPSTIVEQGKYSYNENAVRLIREKLTHEIESLFEGLNPLRLNLNKCADITQISKHPIDLYKELDGVDGNNIFDDHESFTFIPGIFQIINFLGCVPYRARIYKRDYYGKAKKQLLDLEIKDEERVRLNTALTVHNLLRITWLKRLESSIAALSMSLVNYKNRLKLFNKYLDKGYVVSLSDIDLLENEYGEDIERAFEDYDEYCRLVEEALANDESVDDIEKFGVIKEPLDDKIFNVSALRKDIERDKKILDVIISILDTMKEPESNGKVQEFADFLAKTIKSKKYGDKVLVFSFFADTIDYLQEVLPKMLKSEFKDFANKSAFLTGRNIGTAENIACRFSPKAKNYSFKDGEKEIDFLFATDILSEGQNLQDAGFLVNYDLHWNPVRMIQRNGRINRLGSKYQDILVCNMKPHEDLELYLQLVRRLERKIDTIKNSVGTDQSVLGEKENPKEFTDFYSDNKEKASNAVEIIEKEAQGVLSIYDTDDEYAFELREFIAKHENDGEIERISKIPLGKWNYLPDKADYNNIPDNIVATMKKLKRIENYLVLEEVSGRYENSNKDFSSVMFFTVDTSGRYYQVDNVETIEALSIVKTVPSDNKRIADKFPAFIDRKKVLKRTSEQAKIKVESSAPKIDLKKNQINVLQHLNVELGNQYDLQNIIKRGIVKKQDEADFKKLVKMSSKDIMNNGYISVNTKTEFVKFIDKIKENQEDKQIAEKAIGVLVYGNQTL